MSTLLLPSTLLFLQRKAYGAIKTLKCTQSYVIVCDTHTCISLSVCISMDLHMFSELRKILEKHFPTLILILLSVYF